MVTVSILDASNEFATCLTNPLAKPCHEAGINGQIVPEVLFAAEVLPVGILHPGGNYFFVGNVAGVFEQLQSHHQAYRVTWASNASCIQATKLALTGLPVDLLAQLHQRVAQVDYVGELLAKEVRISRVGGLAQCHGIARFEASTLKIYAIFMPQIPRQPAWLPDSSGFSGATTYGHHGGDVALQSLIATSRQMLRDWDIVGRMGGEEFAVLLPETDAKQSLDVAERLRLAVAAKHIPLLDGAVVRLTISTGVATANDTDTTVDTLLERADKALYAAKNSGRDKVCEAPATP